MGSEALAASDAETEADDCTVVDIEEYMGVVPDSTGDYEAGRTVFHATTEEFLDFLTSRMHEPG